MAFKHSVLLLSISSVVALSACGPSIDTLIRERGQYWQRVSTADSIYQQGPKAQQMLNRDIARCVTELRELERLGDLRNAIPTDYQGKVLDPDEKTMLDWDAPERDQELYAEHGDYQDFESCMLSKGWERIKYVPFEVAKQSREDYLDTHVDYRYRSRVEIPKSKPDTMGYEGFGHINE